jgi:ADP-ribose pyrophosphatase YjhB (NUDIX family)
MDECRRHRLVADVAIVSRGTVLLVRYRDVSRYDGQRGWFLPDDFLQHLEHPADAARRIARDQAGLDDATVDLGFIESFGNGAWHLVFHFVSEVAEPIVVEARGNIAAAQWFPIDALPPAQELAHDGWAADVLEQELSAGRTRRAGH